MAEIQRASAQGDERAIKRVHAIRPLLLSPSLSAIPPMVHPLPTSERTNGFGFEQRPRSQPPLGPLAGADPRPPADRGPFVCPLTSLGVVTPVGSSCELASVMTPLQRPWHS